jgi:hypothetical protein
LRSLRVPRWPALVASLGRLVLLFVLLVVLLLLLS